MNSIKLRAGFGNETAVFNLKVLTIAEENKLRAANLGLKEEELAEKEYELNVAALAEFSLSKVEVVIAEGEKRELTVEQYFEKRTAASERIAQYVFRSWLIALSPTVDFL